MINLWTELLGQHLYSKNYKTLNTTQHMIDAKWFPDVEFNVAQTMLQYHNDDKLALIYINENNERELLTFGELKIQAKSFAAGLINSGVKSGDRVIGVLANNPTAIIAMLGTAYIGAIWSSCSVEFGTEAIIDRIGQLEPTVLVLQTKHQYNGKIYDNTAKNNELINRLPTVKKTITNLQDFLIYNQEIPVQQFPFNHPLYILFSSGTTGLPKCIIHGAGGTIIQHLKEHTYHCSFTDKDSLFFYTTCGWMMWNWMVSALTLGVTLVLYDGAPTYPNTDRIFSIVAQEKVTVLGTSPGYLSLLHKHNMIPKNHLDLSSLRMILSTGAPLLAPLYDYVYQNIKAKVHVASLSGGTDIISCFALGHPDLPVVPGEIQCIGLGMDVKVFNEQGKPVINEPGELVCVSPFPSMPLGFWNDPDKKKYRAAYFEKFPNVWAHGDYAIMTERGSLIILGRSDAVLKPGGVRIGTAEIYRQLENINAIKEAVVVGFKIADDEKVILFVTLNSGEKLTAELITHIKQTIRRNASPRHVPALIIEVPAIPKTINGKVVELAVSQALKQQPIKNTGSLANPEALEYFRNLNIKELLEQELV